MQTTLPLRREYVFLLIAVIAVGSLTGVMGFKATLVVIGLCLLAFAFFLSPMQLFLIWLFVTPFTQTRVFSLGASIPDISLDRVLFLVLAVKLGLKAVNAKFRGSKLEIEDGMLAAFLVWALFSILFWKQVNVVGQLVALFQQFLYPIGFYWIVQQVVRKETDLKKVFFTATILLVILCIPAIIEEITGVTPLGQPAQVVNGVTRVRSFLGAPWEFGAVAAMLLMYSLHDLTYPSGQKYKALSWLGAALGGLGIVFCFMRGAWLAAFVAIFFFFVMDKSLRQYLYLIVPLAVGAAILWGPALTASAAWTERITGIGNIIVRLDTSNLQIASILREPVLGNGLMPTFKIYDTGIISHNTALSMFVDFGMFALLYFGAIGAILFRAISNYRKFPARAFLNRGLVLSLGSAALAFLINALTFENRLFIFINALFWVTLGLIKVAIRLNGPRNVPFLSTPSGEGGGNS